MSGFKILADLRMMGDPKKNEDPENNGDS